MMATMMMLMMATMLLLLLMMMMMMMSTYNAKIINTILIVLVSSGRTHWMMDETTPRNDIVMRLLCYFTHATAPVLLHQHSSLE